MEFFYLLAVILLIIMAVSALLVGVSNDAVNFLNSSLGSKVAPFKVIMIIAAIGIIVGTTFSSGMMEVARKGIFNPEKFWFSEIMVIFLAVMVTNILLLDFFNTFAMPTSTTVSIVFGLLGAAVGVSMMKIHTTGASFSEMSNYINTSSALLIITGILLSVVIAFTIGMIIQYIVRMIFSFNFQKSYKYFGAIWGGIAISAITYFILIKGAKGSSFMTADNVAWIKGNSLMILGLSFVGWTLILQLLYWIFRFNILKFIVLVGTFALAMAFAGNDLVNFIGVPLAGIESFKLFQASSVSDPSQFAMIALQGPVKTPTLFLLISGMIMVYALWTSKKARGVTATELNLGRQEEGFERFESSLLARGIVRGTVSMNRVFERIIPVTIQQFLNRRFDQKPFKKQEKKEGISFDLVRASVNLVVASILISFATSMKLPLSTTYVTFMVAMGTSLADGAWGRESAVYRVSGVVIVIGGWFFTALCAFTLSFIMALLIYWGQLITVLLTVPVLILLFIKSSSLYRKRDDAINRAMQDSSEADLTGASVLESCNKKLINTLSSVSKIYDHLIDGYSELRRRSIKKTQKDVAEINKKIKEEKNSIHKTIIKLKEDDIKTGHYYIRVIDHMREIGICLSNCSQPIFEYIDNNHPPLIDEQKKELGQFRELISAYYDSALKLIKNREFDNIDKILKKEHDVVEFIDSLSIQQIKRIKKQEAGTKNSILFLGFLNESRNLILNTGKLIKAQRNFLIHNRENGKLVARIEQVK
ncbi:MAG: inorganic phosphate transporter [Bacteroidales bacterium]|nr:inorganic phosphate transporter [Bacteroidales bacterium]